MMRDKRLFPAHGPQLSTPELNAGTVKSNQGFEQVNGYILFFLFFLFLFYFILLNSDNIANYLGVFFLCRV
jgi:hypothetical protein